MTEQQIAAVKPINPLYATKLPDDVQCYQCALDAAFAAGVAAGKVIAEAEQAQAQQGEQA